MKRKLLTALATVLVVAGAAACGGSGNKTSAPKPTCSNGSQPNIAALAGYQLCVFATSTTAYSHPDSVVVDGQSVYVGYQNITAKDGADHKSSTIVQYDMHGKMINQYKVLGHQDGMRIDPSTHLLWSLSNEDGNPLLFTVDTSSGTVTQHTLPPTPHGGGFDDLVFLNGMAFIDASNPTLNSAGVNVFPALYKISLTASGAELTSVLKGDISATSSIPPETATTLNLIDPDSMTTDPQGDLMLDNQGGSQWVFIKNPGTPQQTVKELPIGTQVDDTVFPTTSTGCLLIVDNGGVTYTACSTQWVPGTPYSSTPNDSGVQGFVGTVGLGTGYITPLIVGLNNPHGMAFVPNVASLP